MPEESSEEGSKTRIANGAAGERAGGDSKPKPQQTAASTQPPDRSALDLHYNWKPGQPYVYSVHVTVDAGTSIVTLDGSSIYQVKSADDSGASLVHRGWLVARRRSIGRDGGPRPEVHMPGNPVRTEIELDPKGDAQIASESLPLPMLGDLSMLVIEPFPDEPLARWDEVKKISLNEIQTSGGAATPLRFGRPAVAGRSREPRLKGSDKARPGTRVGSRAARSPRSRNVPAPAPAQVNVVVHPAQERSEYAIGAQSGDRISISKKYELKTDENVDGEPALLMAGDGILTFDLKQGVPLALEFQAKVTQNSRNVTFRVPITVSCRLLEGEERDRALRFPVIPETAMIPLDEADMRKALAELKATDNTGRREAAIRLRDGRPVESRRPEIVQTLAALIDERDPSLRSAVIGALGVWGNKDVSALLIDRLNDDRYGSRGELFDALGRLEPDEKVVRAMIGWFKRDAGQAGRMLRAFGPPAEPAVLDVVAANNDTQLRIEACRVLNDIGTTRSVPVLERLATKREGEELGNAAAGAIRVITEHTISESDLARTLKEMESADTGRRREAVRRLECVNLIPARQAVVSQALVKLLGDPEEYTQKMAIHELATWGDAAATKALADALKTPSFRAWREAIETLHGKRVADRAAAHAVAGWIKQDRGLVLRTLEEMGPAAEPALIALVKSKEDSGMRADACGPLAAVGTEACFSTLTELASNQKDEQVARAAKDGLRKLEERRLTEPQWKTVLDDLQSVDEEKRRRAAEHLAAVDRDAQHQPVVARALESLLTGTSERTQRDALRALLVWADAKSVKPLIERCEDRQFNPWREALVVIARIDSSPRAVAIILARMSEDQDHAGRLLLQMHTAVEPVVVEALQTATDNRIRVGSCRLLESFGTEASLPVLRGLAEKVGEAAVARAAEEALKGIEERGWTRKADAARP